MSYSIDVVFRIWKDGTVDALMPYEVEFGYKVTCYSCVGQHCQADYDHVVRSTRPALPHEYSSLLKELKSLDYNVTVISRANKSKMRNLWRALNSIPDKVL